MLLILSFKRNVISTFYFIARLFHEGQEFFEIFWLSAETLPDVAAYRLPETCSLGIICTLCPFFFWFRFDDGQAVLQADHIADLLESNAGPPEIPELACPVDGRRIEDHMVVYVGLVRMSCDDEGIFSLCETHGELVTDPVRVFGRDLAGLKRLPDLICDHIIFLSPAGNVAVLSLGEQEFLVTGLRVARITADEPAVVSLFPVL